MRLDLQGNQVTSLGGAAVLRGMPSLTELNLRQNRIAGTLDRDVGFLTALKVLDLRENGIEKLPGSIGLCQALVELHVGHNSLENLPPEIAGCGRLAVLDVRRNRLTSLPVELCTLQLSLLDLTDNSMAILPPQLGQVNLP